MTNMTKLTAAFALCAVLTGCGGGSTGGTDDTPAFGRADPKIEFFPQKPSLLSNRSGFPVDSTSPYFTQANFKITDDNGFPAPGTTIVDLQISNGNIFSLLTSGGWNPTAIRGCAGTASSIATYFFVSGPQAGTAQITASVTAPLTSGMITPDGICTTTTRTGARDVRKTFDYSVNVGPEPFVRLAAVPGRTTLPVNTFNVVATPGSPFVTAVEVTQKTAFGVLVSDGTVQVTVARPDIIQLSVADDPATAVNEFTDLQSTVRPKIVAGKALFYVHSRQRAGTAVVTIQSQDGLTSSGAAIYGNAIELSFTVGSSVAGIANIAITSDRRAVYVNNSNANSVLPIQIRATDDRGESIPDPSPGVNNILLEIVNPNGETLIATNAAGTATEGTSIRTRTSQSIASAVFRAAGRQGSVQIRATGDRSDNNVDNGIQSPIFTTTDVTVSDGKLFDIKITSSVLESLVERRFISTEFRPGANGTPGTAQNGTYGYFITAHATDRLGRPVIPGTVIEFGMIDAPLVGYPTQGSGTFEIAGLDGDPVEGGTRFTAPTGQFTTAGGGAGPGDTLILFGEDNSPIRDLESARLISRINGPTSLDIASSTRFNLNDDSTNGIAVDRGPVVPYVIGRATIGNVSSSRQTTDQFGDVTTTINYPVSKIGHGYIVWARGFGDTPTGQTTPELVTAADPGRFPGAAGANVSLIASPDSIIAGSGSLVLICLKDNFSNPVPAVFVRYGFSKSFGTVDGASTGVVANATGANGCTTALVRATLTGTEDGTISFTANGFPSGAGIVGGGGIVKITKGGGSAQLFAIPGALGGNGGNVTLRLVDGSGNPISGTQVAGSCGAGAGLAVPPGATNAQGETSATITANLNGPTTMLMAECTFSAFGSTAIVRLQGVNTCNLGYSPPPTGCPAIVVPPPPPPQPSRTLTVQLQKADGGVYVSTLPQVQVIGNAGGINCVSTTNPPTNCVGSSIPDSSVVGLTASTGINGVPNAASFCRWTGAPGCVGTQPTVQVLMNTNLTCVAVFSETGPAGCPTF